MLICYVDYYRKLTTISCLKLYEFFACVALSGGIESGEVSGRMFYVLRQFHVTNFLETCYPEAPEDANAQNICQLIMHQLVKCEKALQDKEESLNVATPLVRPTLKRKPSSGSRKGKAKGSRSGNKPLNK